MTTTNTVGSRNRDNQDFAELQVWGKLEYVSGAGAIIKTRGTDTEDEETSVINSGYSFNVEDDFNTEVYLISMGSDTQKKFAVLTIPKDKQHEWDKSTGGVQNPLDPDKRLEFNTKRTWNTESEFAVGDGLFEILNGEVYFRVPVNFMQGLKSDADIETTADFKTPNLVKGILNAPAPVTITDPGWSA